MRYCKNEKDNLINYLEFCKKHNLPIHKYQHVFDPKNTGEGYKLYIAYCECYGEENQEIVDYLKGRLAVPKNHIYTLEDEYVSLAKYFKREWNIPIIKPKAVMHEYCMKHHYDFSEELASKLYKMLDTDDLLRLMHYSDFAVTYAKMGYSYEELSEIIKVELSTLPQQQPDGYIWTYINLV